MKKISLLVICTMIMSAGTWAQNGRHSTITVSWEKGPTCTTPAGNNAFSALSWGFGASEVSTAPTGGGQTGGKATLTDVTITKRTDSCSPLLFEATVRGQHISKVTIIQQDANKDDVFEVVLENVAIANYQISGDESREVPTEQISLSYTKITLIDMITGTKFGWDLTLGKAL